MAIKSERAVRSELSQLRIRVAARAAQRTVKSQEPTGSHTSPVGFTFLVRLDRKEGKFGLGHDEYNCVVLVRPGSAAEDVGVRIGDVVRSVDGAPLTGLLNSALLDKESVELQLVRKPHEPLAWCDFRAIQHELNSKMAI